MKKSFFFPMEISVIVMITVAVFLAYVESSPPSIGYESDGFGLVAPQPKVSKNESKFSIEKFTSNDNKNSFLAKFYPIKRSEPSAKLSSADEIYAEDDEFASEKRSNSKKEYNRKFKYDPALALMGLGKRVPQYDPALKYMGLGKRVPQYDPALKYMGLGKRKFHYNSEDRHMRLRKRRSSYDPGLMYMGLGKRNSGYDPGLKYMGLGKRESAYDYSNGLEYEDDSKPLPDYEFIDGYNDEDIISIADFQKENAKYSPAFSFDDEKIIPYKKAFSENSEDSSVNENSESTEQFNATMSYENPSSEFEKRGFRYNSRIPNRMINKEYLTDKFENVPGLGKRPYKFDPALRLMGLGKRNDHSKHSKRPYKYDPALKYMGLGKREIKNNYKSQKSTVSGNFGLRPNLSTAEQKSFSNSTRKLPDKLEYLTNLSHDKVTKNAAAYYPKPNIITMGVDSLTDRNNPVLLYKGLNKRRHVYDRRMYYDFTDEKEASKRLDKPNMNDYGHVAIDVFQLSKHANKTDLCDEKCLSRKKRSVSSKFQLESEELDDIDDFNYPKKRERDYRPKYNPGWIFIGLGKRNERKRDRDIGRVYDTTKMVMYLDDYYKLLDNIKSKIESMHKGKSRRNRYGLKPEKKIHLKVGPEKREPIDTDGLWYQKKEPSYVGDDDAENEWVEIPKQRELK